MSKRTGSRTLPFAPPWQSKYSILHRYQKEFHLSSPRKPFIKANPIPTSSKLNSAATRVHSGDSCPTLSFRQRSFTDRATLAFALMNTIALFWPILQLLSSAIVLLRLLLSSAIVPIPPSLPRRHCVETPSTQHRPLRPRPPDSGTRINRIHTPAPSFLEEPPTANRRDSTNKPRPLRSQDTDRKIRHPHTPTAHL